MSRIIFCTKLQKQLQGLARLPLPGELGQKIFDQISQEAWNAWLSQQTMLINEYRLSMMDPKARSFLLQEMQNFLFGQGSAPPPGFQA